MLYEIKVLLDQTAPLERAGEWHSALDVCREAFQRSVSERDIGNLIESVLRAGLVYRQMGERELAEEYLELAVTVAQQHGDFVRLGRALNGLATVHHMHGELGSAEAYYREARNHAVQVEDHVTKGYIDQNLGTLAVIRGNPTED